jgi:hypothetical protein
MCGYICIVFSIIYIPLKKSFIADLKEKEAREREIEPPLEITADPERY